MRYTFPIHLDGRKNETIKSNRTFINDHIDRYCARKNKENLICNLTYANVTNISPYHLLELYRESTLDAGEIF